MERTLGVYIWVQFCRAKCSYCNFASGVLGAGASGARARGADRMERYVERVCAEIRSSGVRAAAIAGGAAGAGEYGLLRWRDAEPAHR